MPIFTQSLQRIEADKPQEAIKKMVNHLKYMQEVLEYKLLNLDSSNIAEIDTDKTTITDSTGSTNIGSTIKLTGNNGESFTVGKNSSGQFEFSVSDGEGKKVLYLDNFGNLVLTKRANLTVNGGKW